MNELEKNLSWLDRLIRALARDFSRRLEVEKWSAFLQGLFDSILIILAASVLLWLMRLLLHRVNTRMERLHGLMRARRVATISSLLYSVAKYAAYFGAGMWILAIWGVPVQSLVVGSAIFGAAVGFGSQGVVQDVMTGLSLLAEEQLAVGDFVEIGGKAGAVEEIGLQVVKLRDPQGVQHVIFNRNITMVSNHSSGGLSAYVDVSLENTEAGEAAKRVAEKVCRDLDSELPYFTRVPEIDGVHQSSTNDVFLRLKVYLLPQQEQIIDTLFTARLKHAFAAENIAIPDGQIRVIILSELFTKAAKVKA
jgi:small conductance mechanosensitive channel